MLFKFSTHYPTLANLTKWFAVTLLLSLITGSSVAVFLKALDIVTLFRYKHSWLIFLLPLAGIFIHILYRIGGKDAERGNNLIIDEIHTPGGGIPWRMAPLVLLTTLITHLFGGSAGREGTAVQMGGSLAFLIRKKLKLSATDLPILLMSGIAGGFGAVFGTPVAGAVFAVELPVSGKINHKALLPCLISATLSDQVCRYWGVIHTSYRIHFNAIPPASTVHHYSFLLKIILAGTAFGLVARLFSWLSHLLKNSFNNFFAIKWLIPFSGGTIIILLTFIAGTKDYLGLGVVAPGNAITLLSCFKEGGADYLSWLWKLIFTVITLSTGFKGGEVTPLFFIGAALGNVIATISGTPVDLMAGLGFIAVFAGATNTPIACTLMGIELFGGTGVFYYAIVNFMAYYCSGINGIYTAQRHEFIKGM